MYREKDLFRHATFYCTKNTRYSSNLIDNKSFADTVVHHKRDFAPVVSPKLRMLNTADEEDIKLLNTNNRFRRMARTSGSKEMYNTTMYVTSPSQKTTQRNLYDSRLTRNKRNKLSKRTVSHSERKMVDLDKLSFISNFKK